MTSVISRVEKEFIFKFLINNRVNFEIKIGMNSTFAFLIEQNSKELKLELINVIEELFNNFAEIDVYFYFQNNHHTFKSRILKIKNNIIIIQNPEFILKNLQRKFDRVNIKGKLECKFSIKGDLVKLNYPETAVTYYPTKPPIHADFSDIAINSMVAKFKEKVSGYVSYNQIKMLRNYSPQTFEEQIVIKLGKILYIPDTRSDLPQRQLIPQFSTLLKSDFVKFDMYKNKTQAYQVNKSLSNRLKQLYDKDIFSQAIFPVLYRNYVVALTYLANGFQNSNSIDINIMNYTFTFCKILSYALKESGYFKQEEANIQSYHMPIFDLSPGGLSFFQEDEFFEEKLLLNNNYNFYIKISNNPIRIVAKLVRKFKKDFKNFYGFMFIDISRKDFDFLNNHLYSKAV